jgi:hypothetical protein
LKQGSQPPQQRLGEQGVLQPGVEDAHNVSAAQRVLDTWLPAAARKQVRHCKGTLADGLGAAITPCGSHHSHSS